jgi:hypothetical protein
VCCFRFEVKLSTCTLGGSNLLCFTGIVRTRKSTAIDDELQRDVPLTRHCGVRPSPRYSSILGQTPRCTNANRLSGTAARLAGSLHPAGDGDPSMTPRRNPPAERGRAPSERSFPDVLIGLNQARSSGTAPERSRGRRGDPGRKLRSLTAAPTWPRPCLSSLPPSTTVHGPRHTHLSRCFPQFLSPPAKLLVCLLPLSPPPPTALPSDHPTSDPALPATFQSTFPPVASSYRLIRLRSQRHATTRAIQPYASLTCDDIRVRGQHQRLQLPID